MRNRLYNAFLWLIFYKDAFLCAKARYFTRKALPDIPQLYSVKTMIGVHHHRAFTEKELEFIAESIWWLGWSTALMGFAFFFGFFGFESPAQAFKREYNPIRSILCARQNICCPICLGAFAPDHPITEISPCGHYFHRACLNQWAHVNTSCPLCRCAFPG
jgi:hypothetical protein